MSSPTIDAVIFDMDGVIFDSEKVYYDAFYLAADKHEVEVQDGFVHGFVGKTTQACQLILQSFFDNDGDKTQQFFRDWGEARLQILSEHGLDFKEGFLPLFDLVKASGRSIGLVTSANYTDLQENFERNDASLLNDFEYIITIEDVKHPKPNPQPYNMMIRRLQCIPQACVVIEDSIPGVNAAVAAGANTIMINEHQAPPQELATQLWYHTDHHDNIRTFLQANGL